MKHLMISPTPKPQDVYDSWKKNIPTTKREIKIPFFAIILWFIRFF
jgi:hypothetical protein